MKSFARGGAVRAAVIASLFAAVACEYSRTLGIRPDSTTKTIKGQGMEAALVATSAANDSLTFRLRWGRGEGATGYLAWVRATNQPWAGLPVNLATPDTFLLFTAVKAAWDTATFTAVVKSTNSAGTSLDSAWVAWRVSRLPGAPGPIVVDSVAAPPPPPPPPASPASLAIAGGDNQQDTVMARLATAYAVVVRDASANPLSGVTVTWSVSGGGSVSSTTTTTDASGITSVTRTLGPAAGTQTAHATVTGLTPVSFTATARAGNAAAVAASGGDNQTGTVNTALPVPYGVTVRDAYGNGKSGAVVSWAVASSGGSITPSQSTTDASGVASATRTLGSAAGTQTATATVAGLTPVTFTATAVAAPSGSVAAEVRDDYYTPKDVTVALNTTVTWTWRGSDDHNVVFEDGPVSPYQSAGTYNRTFATAGTYRYRCTAHSSNFTSGMVGSVTAVAPPSGGGTATVQATVETDPSHHTGDTADDVAIWIHPTDPSFSLVIGDDKDGGLMVWGLDGKELQYVDGTLYNNLDLRYRFPLVGQFSDGTPHQTVALVGVGDEGGSRSTSSR